MKIKFNFMKFCLKKQELFLFLPSSCSLGCIHILLRFGNVFAIIDFVICFTNEVLCVSLTGELRLISEFSLTALVVLSLGFSVST